MLVSVTEAHYAMESKPLISPLIAFIKSSISPAFKAALISRLLAIFCLLASHMVHAERIDFQTSNASFANPERGWYNFVPLLSNTPFNGAASANTSLVYTPLGLENYINSAISQNTLTTISNRFDELRAAGLKAILRVAYNYNETGTDATLNNMIIHMDQLAPIIEQHKDVIPYIQVGYFGQWGEWHDWCGGNPNNNLNDDICSKHSDNSNTWQAVLNALLARTPSDRFLQIRYPHKKRAIFGAEPLQCNKAYSTENQARVGHHNDCFLASTDDVGTFSDGSMSLSQQKEFLAQDSMYTPMGGETCTPGDNTSRFQCSQAISELAKQHWVYLNQDFYQGALDTWQSQGCYKEIGDRLGYRIELQGAEFPNPLPKNEDFTLALKLKNTGFSRPHYPRTAYLRVIGNNTVLATIPLPELDLRLLAPNEVVWISNKIKLPDDINLGSATLALWLPDADPRNHSDPRFSIRLAYAPFKATWDGNNVIAEGIGIVKVAPASPENFRFNQN